MLQNILVLARLIHPLHPFCGSIAGNKMNTLSATSKEPLWFRYRIL